jgi:hypothetical protein
VLNCAGFVEIAGDGRCFSPAQIVSLAKESAAMYDTVVGSLRRNHGALLDISLGVVKIAVV